MNLQLNNQPFEKLRICYFRAYDKTHEHIFLDANDEQILSFLTKNICETANIIRIENIEVSGVITSYPTKRKLDPSELKSGISHEDRLKTEEKIKATREKYS